MRLLFGSCVRRVLCSDTDVIRDDRFASAAMHRPDRMTTTERVGRQSLRAPRRQGSVGKSAHFDRELERDAFDAHSEWRDFGHAA
jgi:hypothetical protein